ncbi:MAG: helix-turn-helix transcriptional regulator [Ruminococcus sp.]|nr:helix-turn-helix transcriptional regulator [Ruminococcus sp.]
MQDFGKRIKELRQKAGLTQQQLAERIWVSKAAISNYELYERNPSPEILIKLARVFHVSTDYLLGIEEKTQTLDLSDLTDEDIQVLENTAALLRKKNLEHSHSKKKKREREME